MLIGTIKSISAYAIIGGVVAFGGTYLVKSYFLTKAKLSQAQSQLQYLADKQLESEQAILLAEKKMTINLDRQQYAVAAIIETGHLPGKHNPSWMREHESASIQNKHGSATLSR